jgi:hypothetical protein
MGPGEGSVSRVLALKRMISRKGAIVLLVAVTVALATILLPRFAQPQSYHDFADQRSWLGVRNFWDVASNLPFAVIGIWGMAFVLFLRREDVGEHFHDPRERWPYLVVFVGLVLTAIGSSYYHLHPDNARLVWDRLPITIVFMAMVAAVIAERVNVDLGLWLLPVMLVLGIASVALWYQSELRGMGDLRFYGAVQVYSGLVLLIALLFPAHYTRGSDLAVVVGFYVLAKVFELLDKPIFTQLDYVSGHTLKHLAGAAAGFWILRMVVKRKPIFASE